MPKWLERLAWRAFWLVRTKYLVGVFPVCFRSNGTEVLLIRKRLGMTTGWEVPGGGMQRNQSPESAAVAELREEAGLKSHPSAMRLVGVRHVPDHFDLQLIFQCLHAEGEPAPQDTREIAEARWVSLGEASSILAPAHWDIVLMAHHSAPSFRQ